jgi:YebC/PmpR family DNA-binding regulatory protein
MAGHSQFKNIMHRKGRQDAKKAKVFTKIGREIMVAAKLGGGNADFNPRLRAALIEARGANMPSDRIKKAIDHALGIGNAAVYEETRYEGFGPGGIAMIVDCLTDNRTRSANDVRMIFNKRGGNMGESGSVSYMFDRVGLVVYPYAKIKEDQIFETAVGAGADDVVSDPGDDDENPGTHYIYCAVDQLAVVRDALAKSFGDADKAALVWRPNIIMDLPDTDTATALAELIDALEDHDDVQVVTTNAG